MYRIKQYNISPVNSSFEKAIKTNIRIPKNKIEILRIKLAKKHNRLKSDIIIVKEELRPIFLRNRNNKLTLKKHKSNGKQHVHFKRQIQS